VFVRVFVRLCATLLVEGESATDDRLLDFCYTQITWLISYVPLACS
jgi:hypothetical protein